MSLQAVPFTLTSVVVSVASPSGPRTKMSSQSAQVGHWAGAKPELLSVATRLPALLTNATNRPSALITGAKERLLPLLVPALLTLTSVVIPIERSRT